MRKKIAKIFLLLFLKKFLLSIKFLENKLLIKTLINRHFFLKTGRLRNICMFTGRSGGVYRFFRASRFVIKGLGEVGILPGIQKLS